ncbi:unnamed protein product [Cuscuta europaea]|uniref:VQ domain-containing protein n=1 Tax=Cuscuta europaea TaxID=41803 RepID=A0A9P1EFB3_CUSEU|nr:unnamed protein product [Cuscuta europaea]
MDSGSSGSMQSLSGGGDNEEFDIDSSRLGGGDESIHNFCMDYGQPQSMFLSATTFPQPLPNLNSSFYVDNNINSRDLVWPPPPPGLLVRPEPGFPNYAADFVPPPSSPPLSAILGTAAAAASQHQRFLSASSSSSSPMQPTADLCGPDPAPTQPVKNSKKRSRASRRAPTTVLTTDTANFRQMVQEFTGIPMDPFSVGLPYSRRLDLFSTASGSAHLDGLGVSPLFNRNGSGSNPSMGMAKENPDLFNMQPSNNLTRLPAVDRPLLQPPSTDNPSSGNHEQLLVSANMYSGRRRTDERSS